MNYNKNQIQKLCKEKQRREFLERAFGLKENFSQKSDHMIENTRIAIFKGKQIRKKIHQGEWWFVIVDVIEVLTDSANPRQYLKNILNRDIELAKGWVQIEHPLLIDTPGGKQKINCANTEGIFRIIQSIP